MKLIFLLALGLAYLTAAVDALNPHNNFQYYGNNRGIPIVPFYNQHYREASYPTNKVRTDQMYHHHYDYQSRSHHNNGNINLSNFAPPFPAYKPHMQSIDPQTIYYFQMHRNSGYNYLPKSRPTNHIARGAANVGRGFNFENTSVKPFGFQHHYSQLQSTSVKPFEPNAPPFGSNGLFTPIGSITIGSKPGSGSNSNKFPLAGQQGNNNGNIGFFPQGILPFSAGQANKGKPIYQGPSPINNGQSNSGRFPIVGHEHFGHFPFGGEHVNHPNFGQFPFSGGQENIANSGKPYNPGQSPINTQQTKPITFPNFGQGNFGQLPFGGGQSTINNGDFLNGAGGPPKPGQSIPGRFPNMRPGNSGLFPFNGFPGLFQENGGQNGPQILNSKIKPDANSSIDPSRPSISIPIRPPVIEQPSVTPSNNIQPALPFNQNIPIFGGGSGNVEPSINGANNIVQPSLPTPTYNELGITKVPKIPSNQLPTPNPPPTVVPLGPNTSDLNTTLPPDDDDSSIYDIDVRFGNGQPTETVVS